MTNIPSGDGSVRLVPNIQTFCEWVVRLAGSVRTCVESSEMVIDHIATHGQLPVSAQQDTALAQDLINRGEADPGGATNSDAASAQMDRLGIPNVHLHQDGSSWDWVGQITAGIDRGVASLYGFNQAHLTVDTWTGQPTNQGVYGHGIAIVGYDATGAICADPNTQQAADGNFVHYTWANLLAAASGTPDVITPTGSIVMPYTKDASGNLHYPNGVTLIGYMAAYVASPTTAISETPLTGEIWYTATDAFVPFDGGTVLTIHKDQKGNYTPVSRSEGGKVALGFFQNLHATLDAQSKEEAQEKTVDTQQLTAYKALVTQLQAANLPALTLALNTAEAAS